MQIVQHYTSDIHETRRRGGITKIRDFLMDTEWILIRDFNPSVDIRSKFFESRYLSLAVGFFDREIELSLILDSIRVLFSIILFIIGRDVYVWKLVCPKSLGKFPKDCNRI